MSGAEARWRLEPQPGRAPGPGMQKLGSRGFIDIMKSILWTTWTAGAVTSIAGQSMLCRAGELCALWACDKFRGTGDKTTWDRSRDQDELS